MMGAPDFPGASLNFQNEKSSRNLSNLVNTREISKMRKIKDKVFKVFLRQDSETLYLTKTLPIPSNKLRE